MGVSEWREVAGQKRYSLGANLQISKRGKDQQIFR